ncbi:hypothetical protein A3K72_01630 [Candidatus Woesearchaeota archaeon RBG_13_36_6]|nr:MAG: hypothetical protein A3K72_01630 [Candidatus Woesearchaeota archaeon RBG_13_36_6]
MINFHSKRIQLFIISAIICIVSILFYRFTFNNTTELDTVSHFFGGISVSLALLYFLDIFKLPYNGRFVVLLFICIVGFEVLEYLTGQYPYNTSRLIDSPESKIDTLIDIISGFIGGLMAKQWWCKWESS